MNADRLEIGKRSMQSVSGSNASVVAGRDIVNSDIVTTFIGLDQEKTEKTLLEFATTINKKRIRTQFFVLSVLTIFFVLIGAYVNFEIGNLPFKNWEHTQPSSIPLPKSTDIPAASTSVNERVNQFNVASGRSHNGEVWKREDVNGKIFWRVTIVEEKTQSTLLERGRIKRDQTMCSGALISGDDLPDEQYFVPDRNDSCANRNLYRRIGSIGTWKYVDNLNEEK